MKNKKKEEQIIIFSLRDQAQATEKASDDLFLEIV
jgi:hypothetical protein